MAKWTKFLLIMVIVLTFISLSKNVESAGGHYDYNQSGSLVGYWTLNNRTDDDSGYGNDGNNNGTNLSDEVTGKLGTAGDFVTNDYIDLGNTAFNFNTTNQFTVSAWFKTSEDDVTIIGNVDSSNNHRGWELYISATEYKLVAHMIDTWGTEGKYVQILGNTIVNDSEWHLATMTHDGGDVKLYVDGVNETNIWSGSLPVTGDTTSLNVLIGKRNDNTKKITGKIDEVAIFNRSLNASEIESLYYNNTNGTSLGSIMGNFSATGDVPDSTAPQVNLSSPADNYESNSKTVTYTAYAQDETWLSNCSRYDNSTSKGWHNNQTNTSGGSESQNTTFTFSQTYVNDGYYNFNWLCYDNASTPNYKWNETNRTLIIDTTAPVIVFPENVTLEFKTDTMDDTKFNITDAIVGVDTIWINDTGRFNITTTGNMTNVTTIPIGTYYINVSANDTLGNLANYILNITVSDTTAPTISGFNFTAINSSLEKIGTDEIAFNFSNLEDIEYMNITFTVDDPSGLTGDIAIYFTANGTSACSLGNNQSTTCYNYDADTWIEFRNNTDTKTFYDSGDKAAGDSITCSYVSGETERNYTCQIDEHYNPNVWKHYPLNFSNTKYQSGASERINKNTIWKITLDKTNIPLDANEYKIDFRVNGTIGQVPNEPLLTYICNSTYSTGVPETSPYCQLVKEALPEDLTDDGTKCRGIFTNNLTAALGDIAFVLLETDSPSNAYYSMKTHEFLGDTPVRTAISINSGGSYTNLSDGYETELNINWFYNNTGANVTQIVFKIESEDAYNNRVNSSNQVMTWVSAILNEPPLVDIIIPEIDTNHSGAIAINWTSADPNGDNYLINITASNSTNTTNVITDLTKAKTNYSWDSSSVADGYYNITVKACENETADGLCGNDTHQIFIDNNAPNVTLITYNNSNFTAGTITLNCSVSDTYSISNVSLWLNSTGWHRNTTNSTGTNNVNYTFDVSLDSGQIIYNCESCDNVGNCNFSRQNYTINVTSTVDNAPVVSITINDSTVEAGLDTINILGTAYDDYLVFNYRFNITYPNGTNFYTDTSANTSVDLNSTNMTALGTYTVYLKATDNNSQVSTDTDTFVVADTIAPTISAYSNQTLEVDNSLGYDLDATDNFSFSTWFINDTTNYEINQSGYIKNLTALNTTMTAQINVTVNDTTGNIAYVIFEVVVQDTSAPNVTLVYPTDSSTITSVVDLQCYASDAVAIQNVSLWINSTSKGWHNNVTNSTGTNNVNYNFTVNYGEGIYLYNCISCDTGGRCADSVANYTFTYQFPAFTFDIWSVGANWVRLKW